MMGLLHHVRSDCIASAVDLTYGQLVNENALFGDTELSFDTLSDVSVSQY